MLDQRNGRGSLISATSPPTASESARARGLQDPGTEWPDALASSNRLAATRPVAVTEGV